MNLIEFEWNAVKAAANERKHGVRFDEAMSAFYDEAGLYMLDPDHSTAEERFVLLGVSNRGRVLVVCHTFRRVESVVRIYSARKATRSERVQYEGAK